MVLYLGRTMGDGILPSRPTVVLCIEVILIIQGLLVMSLPWLMIYGAFLAYVRSTGEEVETFFGIVMEFVAFPAKFCPDIFFVIGGHPACVAGYEGFAALIRSDCI